MTAPLAADPRALDCRDVGKRHSWSVLRRELVCGLNREVLTCKFCPAQKTKVIPARAR